jgi:hypothetical protein
MTIIKNKSSKMVNKKTRVIAVMIAGSKQNWKVILLLFAVIASTLRSLFLSLNFIHNNDGPQRRARNTNHFLETATIYPSQCKENVTSSWIKTSLKDHKYQQYTQLSDLFEGPALTDPHPDSAICEFRRVQYWHHFPHAYVLILAQKLQKQLPI